MLIEFEMISNDLDVNYKVFGRLDNNVLIFPDKSYPNTEMRVSIFENEIEIKRSGSVNMLQTFILNKMCHGYYQNNQGINVKIASYTKKMLVEENQIVIEYDYYLEYEWQSSNKLKIIF